MHTIIVLAVGFGLLGLCGIVGRVVGRTPGIATVKGAGYSVADEAPIFLLVFAVPAVAALIVWWNLR